MTVRIIVDGHGHADIRSPFEAKEIIKVIPSRRWSKSGKRWSIDESYINLAADALRQAGYKVFVTDLAGNPYQSVGSHGTRSTPAPDWVAAAFAAAPKDRVDKLRRGLMASFHPDVGGDPEVAKRINAEADRLGGDRD